MGREGIIVGCDKNQEWLLSWWWDHYSAHNPYPVAFADFGMSNDARKWCKERGAYFIAPEIAPLKRKEVSAERKASWEAHFGKGIWFHREICLRKPLCLIESPFPHSIWIDLDCRIRGSLAPLFQLLENGIEIGMRREEEKVQATHVEKGYLASDEVSYNSGVIPYRKGAKILRCWIDQVKERSEEFVFDQHAFARALKENPTPIAELEDLYNWSPGNGPNPNALIYHFHGAFLKDPAWLYFFP